MRGGPFCTVQLRAGREPTGILGSAQSDFSIPSVFAGKYDVELNCQGGYVSSAVFGTSDLLTEHTITVVAGTSPPPIEITMKSGGGSLHGTLTCATAKVGCAVLLVPMFPSPGPIVTWPRDEETSKDTLEISQVELAPGDYTAFAVADPANLEYRNPAVLRGLTGGVGFRIEAGKTTEITVTGPPQ
jgi:hypothetical protein